MDKRVLLIVNPVAGKTQGKRALFPLVDGFCRRGYRVTSFVTAARGEAETVAKEQAMQHDLVVCCGGDGTLGEVINGLLRCPDRVPLGYVPLGSTNDFANSLQLPSRPDEAVRAIVDGHTEELDVGCFNGDRYFSYIASFGAFTAASYNATQSAKNALGHFAYILQGTKELSSLRPYHMRVKTDDRELEGDFLFGAMCNSTSVAGLVKLDPKLVDMSDGLFEAVLVRPPRNLADLGKLLSSINTGVFDKTLFEFFKASRAEFAIEGNPAWSLDGEQAEGSHTVTVENKPAALLLRRQ